jgi:CheY-like chemotaxis protein
MSKKILVIEDEEHFRDALDEILTGVGYEVEKSPFLASAVGKCLSGIYDLITLDLKMPGIDGVQIAGLLNTKGIKTPVLVISGYLDNGIIGELEAAGVHHFLDKPAGVREVVAAVKKALNNSVGN